MRARKLLMLAAAINLAASAEAQDWTRFRGPNGQGQSDAPTIPITWTENDYNWKVELPGIGHSSPVVWGGKVFVTSADPDSATLHVLCLSTANGKELWHRDFASATHKVHTQNNFASSTPAPPRCCPPPPEPRRMENSCRPQRWARCQSRARF